MRRLVDERFPQWSGLPLTPVASTGTDNALYRLGSDLTVRLPRRPEADAMIEKDARWLPLLAQHLPLELPEPLAVGEPAHGYPWRWAVCRWLEGSDALVDPPADPNETATTIGGFLAALHHFDTAGGPPPGPHNFFRGVSLNQRDDLTREAIETFPTESAALTAAWERALGAPEWAHAPVWIHGDLAAGNLLVRDGRTKGILDWGCCAVADPACDLMLAWTLFAGESRELFRSAANADDASWERARGWTLSVALIATRYYLDKSPEIVSLSRHAVDQVLADTNEA